MKFNRKSLETFSINNYRRAYRIEIQYCYLIYRNIRIILLSIARIIRTH